MSERCPGCLSTGGSHHRVTPADAPSGETIMASYPPSESQAAIPDGPGGGPDHDQDGALGDPAPAPGHLGWIVAGSLLVGIVAALALVAAPFIRVDEAAITGAVLCGFAIGWAVLAFATGFTARPQWWAVAPAAFMGL